MAGSYNHATTNNGKLRSWKTMGDAYETIEEMYGMIWFLAEGHEDMVEIARQNYRTGIDLSPGKQSEEETEE